MLKFSRKLKKNLKKLIKTKNKKNSQSPRNKNKKLKIYQGQFF